VAIKKNWIPAVIFLIAFALYIYTLAPGWGAVNIFNTWDGLEYVLCSSLLGVDHPPGHPFYLLLAKIFTSLFAIGSLAFRMNLFSALFGALTAAAVYLVVELSLRLMGKPRDRSLSVGVAAVTAAIFAVSKVFWLHSLITEVHTLYLFLMSMAFYFVLRYLEDKRAVRLYACALSLGLLASTSIFNAITVLFPIALFLLFINLSSESGRLSPKNWSFLTLSFFSGLLFYLYYPLASRLNPGFVHPMNLMGEREFGSLSWLAWFMSGRAWTGGGMFSLGRVILNIPNFFRHMIGNFTAVSFLIFAFVVVYGFKKIYDHFYSSVKVGFGLRKTIAEFPTEGKLFFLFFISYLIVAIPQLSIQDVSNPGSTTFIYLANFFLPSFLIYIFLVGIGLGLLVDLAESKGFAARLLALFSDQGGASEGSKRALVLLLFYCLFILPMYLLATNYSFCNLRGEDTGYDFAKGIVRTLPDNSVVYSKLVFHLVGTYFERVEPIMGGRGVVLENPDVIAKDIMFKQGSSVSLMIDKTAVLKESVLEHLTRGASVYISGDCVDQDKAPEILLISDLRLEPRVPQGLLMSMNKPFPTELIPYGVQGFKVGLSFTGSPEVDERGVANDGNFADMLELIGYSISQAEMMSLGRNKISFNLFWRVLGEISEDFIGVFTLFDEKLRRIDPERTSGFYTLGGTNTSSNWKKEEVIKEEATYYLPNLPFGRYYLALGLLKRNGESIKYLPAEHEKYGQEFDFVLLMPFGIGPQAPMPQGMTP
jgi:hypothetical protein